MRGRKDKKRKKTNVGSETDISTDFSTFADNSFSVNELLTRISTLEGDVFEVVAENKKLKSELKKQNDELNTLKSGLEREKSRGIDRGIGHSNILCKLMTLEALYINQLEPSLKQTRLI